MAASFFARPAGLGILLQMPSPCEFPERRLGSRWEQLRMAGISCRRWVVGVAGGGTPVHGNVVNVWRWRWTTVRVEVVGVGVDQDEESVEGRVNEKEKRRKDPGW